jgi:hypothetical protein
MVDLPAVSFQQATLHMCIMGSRFCNFCVMVQGMSLDASSLAARGSAGARSLLQARTKLVRQSPNFMAAAAAACPPDDDCPDLKINFSYDSNKKVFSDLVASGTFQFIDPTGATGMLGGSCKASAKIPYADGLSKPITASPVLTVAKGSGPKTLKEVKTEMRWSSAATCTPNTAPPPAVPSSNKMFYYGNKCQVVVFEFNSARPSSICNHYYVGRTYAEIGYDDKLPPNTRQSGKAQVRRGAVCNTHAAAAVHATLQM